MLIHDRFEDLIRSNVHFFIRCEGHNAMMIQGRKASLGFITHNFSKEKGEHVNVIFFFIIIQKQKLMISDIVGSTVAFFLASNITDRMHKRFIRYSLY